MKSAWTNLAVLLLSAAAGMTAATGQEATAAQRPRVGLVLSGGGARGFAHVGVLKVLRDLRVPIDAVAGTSMGAVVGGLYAAGLSVDELEQAAVTNDWNDLLVDTPPRADLPFHRKQDDWRYISGLEIGMSDGRLTPPRGLKSGQKLHFMLARYTLRAAGITAFDRLPVPFRCVATDIIAGRRVVLDHGDLASAIRASMSIPALLSPVELDGMLLVDGGAVDNLPVDVARAMGVDVVIAVDVGTPPPPTPQLHTLIGITRAASGILVDARVREQRQAADVLITPALTGFSNMAFNRGGDLVQLGEQAAREAAAVLAPLGVSQAQYQAYLSAQQRSSDVPLVIGSVRVQGATHVRASLIARRLRTMPGRSLDLVVLREDIDRLYNLGEFDSVTFAVERAADGWDLLINTREKAWGPNQLRFAFNFVTDLEGQQKFSLLGNYTRTAINALGGIWKIDVQGGRTRGIRTDLYQPLDAAGRFFVAPNVELGSRDVEVYDKGARTQELTGTRLGASLDFGVNLGLWGQLRVGLTHAHGRLDWVNQGPADNNVRQAWGAARAQLLVDRLDNSNIPRRGVIGSLELQAARRSLGSDSEYDRIALDLAGYHTHGRTTMTAGLTAGWAASGVLPISDDFRAGGFLSFSGYREGELAGQALAIARLGAYRNVWRPANAFSTGVYCGGWVEAGNVWASRRDASADDLRTALTLGCGTDTIVGPLYVTIAKAAGVRPRAAVSLGRRF